MHWRSWKIRHSNIRRPLILGHTLWNSLRRNSPRRKQQSVLDAVSVEKLRLLPKIRYSRLCFLPPNNSPTSIQQKFDFFDSPIKDKPRGRKRKKSGPTESEESDESDVYVSANLSQSENSSDEPLGDEVRQDIAELGVPTAEGSKAPTRLPPSTPNPVKQSNPTSAFQNRPAICAMCGNLHHGTCGMAGRSENLVHYRQILFTEETGESFEERVCPLSTLWLCSL
jgi:hypothetical protein